MRLRQLSDRKPNAQLNTNLQNHSGISRGACAAKELFILTKLAAEANRS
jgi:hypothetical protein